MFHTAVKKSGAIGQFENGSFNKMFPRLVSSSESDGFAHDVLPYESVSPFDTLIDSIGCGSFYKALMDVFVPVCSVDHLGIFNIKSNSVQPVGASSIDGSDVAKKRMTAYADKGYWKHDPSIDQIRQSLRANECPVIQVDVQKFSEKVRRVLYSDVVDKVIVTGARKDEGFSVTLVRTGDKNSFSDDELNSIYDLSGSIISAIAKHFELSKVRPSRALSVLPDIENTIVSEGVLTQREAQVCARVLYGMCVTGIALDLGIGEETIKTYRSRAYSRLNIGSQRELLMWYLSVWNAFDA